jgi:hypothetical protein
MSKRLTTEDFFCRARKIHRDKYDYSKVEYKTNKDKVCIVCPIHGEFWQAPNDHLKGCGCTKCKYIAISQKMSKWSKERVYELSKKYDTLKSFRENEYGCYCYARKNGLIENMGWLKRAYKEINEENVILESKKYNSRVDFERGSKSHYAYARKHKMLDNMVWLKPKTNKHPDGHYVYAYIDEENKVAYIGQTMRLKERDYEHRKELKSPVFRYFNELSKEIPKPIYLETNLQDEKAQIQEDYWVQQYKKNGYKLLNKAPTGLYSSSLGICRIKWTKDRIFNEAKKYNSSGDFKKGKESAYQIACRKGWILDLAEKLGWKLRIKWNKDTCLYYAKQCDSKADFKRKYQAGYKYAREHKLFDILKWRMEKLY